MNKAKDILKSIESIQDEIIGSGGLPNQSDLSTRQILPLIMAYHGMRDALEVISSMVEYINGIHGRGQAIEDYDVCVVLIEELKKKRFMK